MDVLYLMSMDIDQYNSNQQTLLNHILHPIYMVHIDSGTIDEHEYYLFTHKQIGIA